MRRIGNWDADFFLNSAENGGFEAGEGKIKVFNLGVRELIFF